MREASDSCDVFQDDESGSKNAEGVGDEGEDGSLIVRPALLPSSGEWSTRKSGAQGVDRFDLVPVDGGEVAEVPDTGPMVSKDLRAVLVDL